LHDETSNKAQYYGAKHEYINCNFYADGTNAIGSGHCRNQTQEFTNCVFKSSSGNSVFMHDWPSPANGKSNIIFNNCVVTGGIVLNSCDTVGRLDSFKLFNCFITNGNLQLIADDQVNTYLQGYAIETIGTTELNFTHYDNVTVSDIIRVPRGCCSRIRFGNVSASEAADYVPAQNINVQNLNITIDQVQ
jgi:hypothetical protein